MYLREESLGSVHAVHKEPISGNRIALLVLVILLGLAWHFGIVASVASALQPVAKGIWDMLRDAATSVEGFIKFVLSQRQ